MVVLNILYKVYVFWADWKTKMATLASDWLRQFIILCNHCTDFNKTWQDATGMEINTGLVACGLGILLLGQWNLLSTGRLAC